MKFLLRLVFNRLILSLLIILFFALDYNFVKLNPVQYYAFEKPVVAATEYYEIELGEAKFYVHIAYDNERIHLVPTNEVPSSSLTLNKPIISWYYYGLALALANIIPFGFFFKSNKKKDKKKR
ncbi:hypothetical protein [Acholeplasma hippikon]|uniref:Uncharacterized protein n=1 Tax=Acholeplasma hippikon TaxID=264636 RepID=A0A449BJI1_9MOLU|nr:hypothetical protein [Acholeplasma hippikon]VEU82487.1 Uncharacterised protein [Acholeplasma hippikon]